MSQSYGTGLLTISIVPKTPEDGRRLNQALERLTAEDPALQVRIDQQSRAVFLGCSGELHLEVVIDRLHREFNVEASLGRPQVAYREIAGFHAALDAARNAAPVVLEPVMLVEVTAPEEYADEVGDNLVSRHGRIDSRDNRDGTIVIHARVPLAGLFGYATDLRTRTFGRGAFKTRFFGYRPCRITGRDDDAGDSIVGAPLKPRPGLRDSSVALPEPDDGPPVSIP